MLEYFKVDDKYLILDSGWGVYPENFDIEYKTDSNLRLIGVDFELVSYHNVKLNDYTTISGSTMACKNKNDAIKIINYLDSLILMKEIIDNN